MTMDWILHRLRGRTDQGLSLVELLVAMLMTGIVLTIAAGLFVNVAKVTTVSNASTTRSSTAANVMNEIAEVVRSAADNANAGGTTSPAIVSGTGTSLTLTSLVDTSASDPAPTKVAFRIDSSGNLVEDRWAATTSQGYWVFTGAVKTRVIGGPLQTAGADALFTYVNESGVNIVPAGSGASLSTEQLVTVASIKVTVTLTNRSVAGNADPIIIVNTIGMPNLKLTRTDD